MSEDTRPATDAGDAIPVIALEPMPPAWAVRLGCLRIAAELRTGATTPHALVGVAQHLERWVTGAPARED